MNLLEAAPYIIIFLFGILVGSFLNVCIYRIPQGESVVTTPSHCMVCGRRLHWFELVPLFSWLCLGGKCHGCKTPISPQYPLIEALNGILWVICFYVLGFSYDTMFCCAMTSALLVLSVIDGRIQEIPFSINVFIFVVALLRLAFDFVFWKERLIGFFCVSLVLLLVAFATGGGAIGGGDIKLMAVCGLFIGWKAIVLAFFLGCIIGSVVHIIRMVFFGAGRNLALGPYLSVGVFLAMLWGEHWIHWYFELF